MDGIRRWHTIRICTVMDTQHNILRATHSTSVRHLAPAPPFSQSWQPFPPFSPPVRPNRHFPPPPGPHDALGSLDRAETVMVERRVRPANPAGSKDGRPPPDPECRGGFSCCREREERKNKVPRRQQNAQSYNYRLSNCGMARCVCWPPDTPQGPRPHSQSPPMRPPPPATPPPAARGDCQRRRRHCPHWPMRVVSRRTATNHIPGRDRWRSPPGQEGTRATAAVRCHTEAPAHSAPPRTPLTHPPGTPPSIPPHHSACLHILGRDTSDVTTAHREKKTALRVILIQCRWHSGPARLWKGRDVTLAAVAAMHVS